MASGRVIPHAPVTAVPTPPILLATVDLNNPGTAAAPVWQFVYGSQLYHTLFAVYANFRTTPLAGGGFEVHDVKLKLINYQGVINIGFTDEVDPVYKPNDRKLYFGVRGGSQYSLPDTSCSLIAPAIPAGSPGGPAPAGPLRVTRGTPSPLTFSRMLYPMEAYNYPVGARQAPDAKQTHWVSPGPFFDSEFQNRSGYDYYNEPARPGLYNHLNLDLNAIRGMPLGSPRCHEGVANLTA